MDDSAGFVERRMLACTFRIGQHWFGVDARWVQEISLLSHVTPIPHAFAAVQGYVNLRGQLQLVLDLHDAFGTGRPAEDGRRRLIVFKPTVGEAFAIVVDQVGDIVELDGARIDLPAARDRTTVEFEIASSVFDVLLVGYAKLDHALVALLDPRRFLDTLCPASNL